MSQPAVSDLIEALNSPEPPVRKTAARVLGQTRPKAKAAVPALLRTLQDEDPSVRAEAALALLAFPINFNVVPALITGLRDQDKDLRRRAAWALSGLGREAAPAARALCDALQDVRIEQRDRVTVFTGADLDMREPVQSALEAIGLEAVPTLADALKEEETNGRWKFLCGILHNVVRQLRAPGASLISREEAAAALPALIETLKDERAELRYLAAVALAAIGPEARAALPALREVLRDQHPRVQLLTRGEGWLITGSYDKPTTHLAAAEALWSISGSVEEALPVVLQILEKGDAVDCCRAALVLGRMGPAARSAEPVLRRQLEAECPSLRLVAAEALWRITQSTRDSLPILLQLLQDHDSDFLPEVEDIAVDCRVARVIGEMGAEAREAVPALQALLTTDKGRAGVAAAESLFLITGSAKGGLPVLIEAVVRRWQGLGGFRVFVSEPALEVLARMGPEAVPAVPHLMDALDDETVLAARALGAIGPEAKAAVPKLVKLLGHKAVAEALRKIDPEAAEAGGAFSGHIDAEPAAPA